MKKIIFLLFVMVFCSNFSFGQAPSFIFSSSMGTYTENAASATLLPLVRADSYISPNQDIGFAFNYQGTSYTQFKMSSNGFISFNATGGDGLNSNDLSVANATTRPIIAPLWDDNDGATPINSVASFQVTGTAPNRVLTVEWRNWEWNWLSNTAVISFEVKLFETSNVIQFVYRQEPTAVNAGSASIGLGSVTGTGVQSFLNVTTDIVPSVTSAISVINISVKPATGQTYTFTPSTCAHPVGLVATNIVQQSATLSWTADIPAATGYEYVVQPASAATFGTPTSVVTNTINVTGLLQNTTYNVYLRKNCGTGFSGWVIAGTFTTLCNAQTEFSEDFETSPTGTAFLPGCFSKGASTGSVNNTTGSVAPMSPNNRLFMSISATTNAFLILPQVNNLQAYTHRLKFKAYANAAARTISVGYLTNPSDLATFVLVQSVAITPITAATASEFTVIPTGIPAGVSNLVLSLPTGTATTMYIDDIKWEPNTTCVEPTALIATSILTTTAQLDWTEPTPAAANGYEYFLSTSSLTPLSTATPTGSVGFGLNSINLTGLIPSTTYNVWVRSRCNTTDRSPWSSRLAFLTNCTNVPTFTQNFDAALTFPACWKKLGPGGTGSISTIASVSPSNALLLSSAGTTIATQGLVIMPPVSNAGAGTHRLVFRARSSATVGGVIEVGYVTDNFDNNTFVSVQSFTTTSITAFDSFSAILGTAPGTNRFLAFRHAGAPNTNPVLIDNVSWEAIPSCIEPSSVAASSVTNNNATISWTEPLIPAALGYQYFLSTTNTAPSAASLATGSVGAGLSTVNLNSLLPQTTYFVWVRSRCTASDSSAWTASTTFTTLCSPINTLPWNENFDTTATGTNVFPPCWGFENILNTWTISTTPTPAFSGANLLRRSWSTNGWAFTPTMTLTAGVSYEFSYWMRANDTTAPGYTIQTAVGLGQNAASMTTTLDTKTNYVNATWAKVTLNFSPTTSGAYSFGVRAEVPTAEPNGINFDDFRVQLSPSCFNPTAVVATTITSATATVSWTAPAVAPANGYQYFISTSNIAPNAASVATASTAASVTTVNLTGLTPNTQYFVWVRGVCSASSTSEWSISLNFRTTCIPSTTLPWTENFDTTATGTNVFPPCWGFQNILSDWSISTTPTPAFSGANQLRRTWSTNGWAFTPTMTLTAGISYDFSFWVRTNTTTLGYTIQTAVGIGQNSGAMTTTLGTQSNYAINTWTKVTYSFMPATTGAYSFGVRTEAPSAPSGINFDDFRIELSPSCLLPTNPVASAITTTSATITWTAPSIAPANGYQYFLSTTNTAPLASSVATGSTAASVTSVSLASLMPSTNYFVWVRSVCSVSDSSTWTALPLTFQTLCASATTLNQNFDVLTIPALPACWFKVGTPGTANTQATGAFSATNCLYIYSLSNTARAVVAMPPVSNAGSNTHWLKFKARANFTAGGVIEVGYLTNPLDDATFVSVQSFTATSVTVYDNFTANLGTAPGANQVLAFRHTGVPANSILIDDVSWEAQPTCNFPTNIVANNLTTTGGTLTWTAPLVAPANGSQYFLSTVSTQPNAASVATGSTAVGITTLNLTGLVNSTSYFISVRSVCSASSTSDWSPIIQFSTLCLASTVVPYSQNFESAVVPNIPNCTTILNAGTGNNWTVAANPGSGFTSNTLQYQWNATNDANAWFFTNGINLIAGTQYKLDYRYGTSNTTGERLRISYGSAATVAGMTTELVNHSNVINTTPIAAPTITFTPSTTGVYFFGFNAYSILNRWRLFVDDIAIDTVLSNNTFDNGSFSYYPNPVKDILNLDYNQNITNVSVFNLLGQQVITKTVNANQSKIDMSNLNAGTYLVKVTADNQVKTIKVIKE